MSTTSAAVAVDADEFQRLISAHRGIILKIVHSYCCDPEDRADLAQEIALQLWDALDYYDDERPFSTWMYRVALNVAISHRRRERLRRQVHAPSDDEHESVVGAQDVDGETQQQLRIVQRGMQLLSALDRAILLLHLEGCSHRESGEVLGLSDSNVATRLNRIRHQLRRHTGPATSNEGE